MNCNWKWALIIGGIVLAVMIVVPPLLGGSAGWRGGGSWGMMGPGMMGGFGMGFLGPVVMIVFWGLIIWAVVALVRGNGSCCGAGHSDHGTDSAMEVLKRRYARGEISKDEFEDKKKDLA